MRIHDIINEDGEATSTLSNSVATVAFPLFGDQKMIRRAVDPKGYLSGKKKKKKVAESSMFADNVIYRLDPANPMDDSEILVIGGAGRYSLKGLRAKARREADQLAKDLQSEHGQSFRDGAYNINQLSNTLKTIVAAYDQLNKIRSKGGTKARGIRNEDKTLVDECMNIAEQWMTKFKSKVTQ